MKMDRLMTERRYADFPEPIRVIARNNAVVHRVIQEYAHGAILTREEALAQMVVRLSQDWTALNEKAVKLHMQLVQPVIKP